jgi:hypothetical protein
MPQRHRRLLHSREDEDVDQVVATERRWVMACDDKKVRRYPRAYAALIRAGHTAAKAAEIIRDAKRKRNGAVRWIKLIRRL